MIIYSGTKDSFISDVKDGDIEDKIDFKMRSRYGKANESQFEAWHNSLPYMSEILDSANIPGNAGIAIEYGIPYTSKRVDMIVTGFNESGKNSAVIIEPKL